MRYLCLVYSVEDPANTLSDSEAQALIDESLEYDEQLSRVEPRRRRSDARRTRHRAWLD
jgi:hypothetical protein